MRLYFTCSKWQECRIFLKVAILVQEVLRVEGQGSRPLLFLFQHRVQQGYDHCVLSRQDEIKVSKVVKLKHLSGEWIVVAGMVLQSQRCVCIQPNNQPVSATLI